MAQKKEDGQYERHPTKITENSKIVRTARTDYLHVGPNGPEFPLRNLTVREQNQYEEYRYVKFEEYPKSENSIVGRFWTQNQLDAINKGCGFSTKMGTEIAKTYASNPSFYDKTFCSKCKDYFPVGKNGKFVWINQDGNISKERVGT